MSGPMSPVSSKLIEIIDDTLTSPSHLSNDINCDEDNTQPQILEVADNIADTVEVKKSPVELPTSEYFTDRSKLPADNKDVTPSSEKPNSMNHPETVQVTVESKTSYQHLVVKEESTTQKNSEANALSVKDETLSDINDALRVSGKRSLQDAFNDDRKPARKSEKKPLKVSFKDEEMIPKKDQSAAKRSVKKRKSVICKSSQQGLELLLNERAAIIEGCHPELLKRAEKIEPAYITRLHKAETALKTDEERLQKELEYEIAEINKKTAISIEKARKEAEEMILSKRQKREIAKKGSKNAKILPANTRNLRSRGIISPEPSALLGNTKGTKRGRNALSVCTYTHTLEENEIFADLAKLSGDMLAFKKQA